MRCHCELCMTHINTSYFGNVDTVSKVQGIRIKRSYLPRKNLTKMKRHPIHIASNHASQSFLMTFQKPELRDRAVRKQKRSLEAVRKSDIENTLFKRIKDQKCKDGQFIHVRSVDHTRIKNRIAEKGLEIRKTHICGGSSSIDTEVSGRSAVGCLLCQIR